jgi:DNA-binding transcriptional MerR regulator
MFAGEVAEMFGVSRRTIYNWTKRGLLPARQPWNNFIYDRTEMEAIRDRCARRPNGKLGSPAFCDPAFAILR